MAHIMADARSTSLRVRVTPAELAKIRQVADDERRTVSQLVWIAIQQYLAKASA